MTLSAGKESLSGESMFRQRSIGNWSHFHLCLGIEKLLKAPPCVECNLADQKAGQ